MQGRNEHKVPFQAFGLVNRHHLHRCGVGSRGGVERPEPPVQQGKVERFRTGFELVKKLQEALRVGALVRFEGSIAPRATSRSARPASGRTYVPGPRWPAKGPASTAAAASALPR